MYYLVPFLALSLGLLVPSASAARGSPEKIHGVNLGNWLIAEGWMMSNEWGAMGGENCDPCGGCVRSDGAFARFFPDDVDAKYKQHWETWFTQKDVDDLVDLGINAVRIPIGWYIIEQLVDRKTEFFPRGGLASLRRGLDQLHKADIAVVLDLHGAPGAQRPDQAWTGNCTKVPQFYTPENYHRALVWTAVMTTLSHIDPVFGSVFAIQAVNNPLVNATLTPGYGDYQQNFVLIMRLVEMILGVDIKESNSKLPKLSYGETNITYAFTDAASSSTVRNFCPKEVLGALLDARVIVEDIVQDLIRNNTCLEIPAHINTEPLIANFMDVTAQNFTGPNAAEIAIGPTSFDHHLFFADDGSGNVSATQEGYLRAICQLPLHDTLVHYRNAPYWLGEWTLTTQLGSGETDAFLKDYADAQKIAYNDSLGWFYWNFKTESPGTWSYIDGVKKGWLTKDPAAVHNPHVCDKYWDELPWCEDEDGKH
ncbi:glycoside hydrolase family 5 protein [Moniliophthora roreri MCA 2997]|uniref:Glycoside hydrolase family 5 protein n=2 Tax=Moniliophthora roreri TaxID=221103 RepID=V2WR26_MONRO|nr:glycoside hydrolase family 5 protein [Moniliophthora roreri MCA 2997]KAI3598522.1 glycoside hydrolase family 5 protein [Moniliophthora roreri]